VIQLGEDASSTYLFPDYNKQKKFWRKRNVAQREDAADRRMSATEQKDLKKQSWQYKSGRWMGARGKHPTPAMQWLFPGFMDFFSLFFDKSSNGKWLTGLLEIKWGQRDNAGCSKSHALNNSSHQVSYAIHPTWTETSVRWEIMKLKQKHCTAICKGAAESYMLHSVHRVTRKLMSYMGDFMGFNSPSPRKVLWFYTTARIIQVWFCVCLFLASARSKTITTPASIRP
jgi:hypothetical protein